jgi:S1-C subfamily serine protease
VFIGIKGQLPNLGTLELIGNGSGAIIDAEGHILTNNHVVENAEALVVTLPDGRSFDATVVGRDPATDLAVIQIQGDNLPTIPLGNSDDLHLGDFVIAIGNALGLEGGPTVTVGVVSATERTITEENGASISGLIQTDAAINPGNSGGPLVNLKGELIGINTAVAGSTPEGYQPAGISFAIAVNEAIPIQEQLLTQGRVIRPYLGVTPVTVTPALRAQFSIAAERGVILTSVASNSPAAQAGLRPGDIVVQAGGQELQNAAELREIIRNRKIGDALDLVVMRDGTRMDVTAMLSESPPLP